MRPYAKTLIGAAAAALMSTAASAADFVTIQPAAPAPMAAPGFDWSGPYAGAFFSTGVGGVPSVGVQYGYNFLFGSRMLAGLEVTTSHWSAPGYPLVDASLNARLGIVADDRVLLYGELGIGTYIGAIGVFSAGGGVEIAVSNSFSAFGEVKRLYVVGALAPIATFASIGVNYHPGGSTMTASSGGFGGLYMGTFAGYDIGPNLAEFGVQVGFNHVMGRFVAGAEVETYYPFTGGAILAASLNARLGATFGNFLAYAQGGIGTWVGVPVWNIGGGVEFAMGNRGISLFTEATGQFLIGGGYFGTRIDAGINYAAGN